MIFSIGHSTRPIEELTGLLRANGIETLVDVRTVPRSRHNPQFNRENLPAVLAAAGIRYRHIPQLGGLRHPRKDSINTGWRNASFRGFADYMQTSEFETGLRELLAVDGPLAIMCAESVPWRCHRSLIADALLARGIQVEHIIGAGAAKPHALTSFARVEGQSVTYPGAPTQLLL